MPMIRNRSLLKVSGTVKYYTHHWATDGFGYDPIFWDPALQMSAAQMPAELKNRISHRGQALQQLKQKLQAHA